MKIGKKMKKLVAIAISATMVMAMAVVPAFAANDYTITVENSIGGSTYSAYKVFDVTGSGDTVSYTIDSSSAWFEAVNDSDVFTLTQSGSSTTYYVTATGTDAEIIAFLNSTYETLAGSLTASATESGTGGAITLDVGAAGYYYVTTSQGTTASITTAAPTATIMDKNQTPGTGGKDPKDPDWDGGFSKDADGSSYSVGDEITYTIKSYVPTYDGDKVIGTYTITDTMGEGLTYDNDMKVTLIGTGLNDYEDITQFCTIELNETTNTLTITWNPADIEAMTDYSYPSDAVVTITYTDTVNEAADDLDLTNNVSMQWTRLDPTTGEPDPDDPDPGTTEDNPDVTVYTYGFDLQKTDGTNLLSGAQFSLAAADGTLINFLYDATSDTYEVWDGSTSGTTTTTITVADGELNIWGLGAGTYTLTELVAPDGYNLLTSPVTITITESTNGWIVSANGTTSNGVMGDAANGHGVVVMPQITVVNASGSILPGTGGMGTLWLYIIGAAIVAGAVVVVVTRRRRVA